MNWHPKHAEVRSSGWTRDAATCDECPDLWDLADDAYERVRDERLEQEDYERRNV